MTLCAKNYYGVTSIYNDWHKNAHNNFNPDRNGKPQYLIEAALVDNPPSKTKYDPQRNNAAISSLGVMEHWNNAIDKKYSRDLGKNEGIELVLRTIPAK